ncbi:MAG: AraC family transcriptional regulator, partial [Oscillospiraceae bacterium]
MIYLDSGCLKYKLDNNEMLLRQGDMLFCDVNQHHSMRTESDKMVSFANMSFCLCIPEIYRNFFGQIIKANQQQKSMIEMMVNEYKLSDNVSYDFIINNINNLILSVIRQKNVDVSSQVTKTPHVIKTNNTMVNKAIDIINQNITNGDLTVSWIAKALNVSTSYLHRTFKEVLNNNVVNIIKEKKMSYAKFLLSEGELSITEISGLLGFCSQSYFSTQFRETYDMTPREYSNQVCHKLDGGC